MIIGIFDSGVGGLAVYLPLKKSLSNVSFLYLADQNFAPYGEKSRDEIIKQMRKITKFFLRRGIKFIVIACNTATVNTINLLRHEYPQVEFVGLEPAIKPAAQEFDNIIVLGTNSTVKNQRYSVLVERYAQDKKIWNIGAPELVRQVETGNVDREDLLHKKIDQAIESGAQALVIGCTHFSFLIPTIKKIWPKLAIFDGAEGVVRRAIGLLTSQHRGDDNEARVRDQFFTTGLTRLVDFIEPPIEFKPVKLDQRIA